MVVVGRIGCRFGGDGSRCGAQRCDDATVDDDAKRHNATEETEPALPLFADRFRALQGLRMEYSFRIHNTFDRFGSICQSIFRALFLFPQNASLVLLDCANNCDSSSIFIRAGYLFRVIVLPIIGESIFRYCFISNDCAVCIPRTAAEWHTGNRTSKSNQLRATLQQQNQLTTAPVTYNSDREYTGNFSINIRIIPHSDQPAA